MLHFLFKNCDNKKCIIFISFIPIHMNMHMIHIYKNAMLIIRVLHLFRVTRVSLNTKIRKDENLKR